MTASLPPLPPRSLSLSSEYPSPPSPRGEPTTELPKEILDDLRRAVALGEYLAEATPTAPPNSPVTTQPTPIFHSTLPPAETAIAEAITHIASATIATTSDPSSLPTDSAGFLLLSSSPTTKDAKDEFVLVE